MLNIEFKDGNKFIDYSDDTYYYGGCPTCDYGSEYINEITIRTTNHIVDVKFDQMYEYAFSTARAIEMFAVDLKSMTEDEFISYIDEEFHKISGLDHFVVR